MRYMINTIIFIFVGLMLLDLIAIPVAIIKNDKIPDNIDIKSIPGEKEYPEYDYVVAYDHEDIDVDWVRGVGIESYIKGQSIYKYLKSSNKYNTLNWFFDKDDTVKSFSVTTYKPDGRKYYLSEKDLYIEQNKKTGVKHKGEFWEVTYPVPALENGDVVVVEYFVISKGSRVDKNWYIQRNVPVLKTSKTISFPGFMIDNKDLGWNWRYTPFNFDRAVEPKKSKNMGDYVFSWSFSNIEPFKDEPVSEIGKYGRKYIKFDLSGSETWGEFSIWYYKNNIKDLFSTKPHETISKKAKELTDNAKNIDEKIHNIVMYVQKLPYDATPNDFGHGWLPNKPEEILRRGHGDCKDKTILIMALLKVINVDADPVILLTRGEDGIIYPEVPDPSFNHMIVRIHYPGKENSYIWADGTTDAYPVGELPFADSDRWVLIIKEKGVKNLIKTAPFEHKVSHVKYKRDISLNINDLEKAEVDFSVTGFFEDAVYNEDIMRNYSKKNQDDNFRNYIYKFYPFNEVKDVKGSKDSATGGYTISFRSSVKPGIVADGKSFSMDPFILDFGVPHFDYEKKYPRKTDIYLGAPDVKESHIKIIFPENLKVIQIPESTQFIFKDVFVINSNILLNGNILSISVRAEQKGSSVLKEDAESFSEFLKKIKTYIESRVYLQ